MNKNKCIYNAITEGNEEKLAAAIMDELDMHVKAEALVTAVRHQQTECVKTLLREGCDPCLKHAGRTALYWAVRLDDVGMLDLLLEDLVLVIEAGFCVKPRSIKRTHSGNKADILRMGSSTFDKLQLNPEVEPESDRLTAEVKKSTSAPQPSTSEEQCVTKANVNKPVAAASVPIDMPTNFSTHLQVDGNAPRSCCSHVSAQKPSLQQSNIGDPLLRMHYAAVTIPRLFGFIRRDYDEGPGSEEFPPPLFKDCRPPLRSPPPKGEPEYDSGDEDVLAQRSLFPEEDASCSLPVAVRLELAQAHLSYESQNQFNPVPERYTLSPPERRRHRHAGDACERSEEDKMRLRAQQAINEALFEAASHGAHRCVARLLETAHANPNAYHYHDDEFLSWSTPLLAACFAPIYCQHGLRAPPEEREAREKRYVAVTEALVGAGADISKQNCYGDAPLHWAAASGMGNVVQLLLRNGADINQQNSLGRTPLIVCLEHNGPTSIEVAEILTRWGAKLNITDADKWTALHYAVDGRNIGVARVLLQAGASVNACVDVSLMPVPVRDMIKITPLDIAITAEHIPLVRLLIKWNANVNLRSKFNSLYKSAVELAVDTENVDTLKLLHLAGVTPRAMRDAVRKFARSRKDGAPEKVARLQAVLCVPHSLRHSARLTIRRQLRSILNVACLPLPNAMQKYVCFDDLDEGDADPDGEDSDGKEN